VGRLAPRRGRRHVVADMVRVELVIEYPFGSPASYGGETDPDKQVVEEEKYLKDESDYLLAVLSSEVTTIPVMTVSRVSRG
jgi:hypothetical protein